MPVGWRNDWRLLRRRRFVSIPPLQPSIGTVGPLLRAESAAAWPLTSLAVETPDRQTSLSPSPSPWASVARRRTAALILCAAALFQPADVQAQATPPAASTPAKD